MSAVTENSQASPVPVRTPAPPVGSVFELGWLMAQLFDDRRRKSFDVRQLAFNQTVQLPLVADLADAELLKFLMTDLHDLVVVFPDVSDAGVQDEAAKKQPGSANLLIRTVSTRRWALCTWQSWTSSPTTSSSS